MEHSENFNENQKEHKGTFSKMSNTSEQMWNVLEISKTSNKICKILKNITNQSNKHVETLKFPKISKNI